jgi:hypothetical protein
MLRKFRTLLLLIVLATVGLTAWRTQARLTAWELSIHVALYPIAADDSPTTAHYIGQLDADSVAEIGQWIESESRRYGKSVLQPVVVRIAPPLASRPPLPPAHPGALDAILWSLQLRWWAARHDTIIGPKPQIRLFVLYHDPERTPALPHSTGLSKGQLGLIHAFASRLQHRQNAVIIAHELLHVFGASDKYDPASGQPIHPQGYAEPTRSPLLPQDMAEIMGGRVPLAAGHSEIPDGLAETLIGPDSAREIGLLGR